MKFSCLRENFLQAITLSAGAIGKNPGLPILAHALIKAVDQKVELIGTNLEFAVVETIRAKVEVEGVFTVPARTLNECVNLLRSERLDIELSGTELVVRGGKSTTKIKGLAAEEFPVIPVVSEGVSFLIDASKLRAGLAATVIAAARTEIRPELAAVVWRFNKIAGELRLAATDSYRLSESVVVIKEGAEKRDFILPFRAAQELARLLGLSGSTEPNVRLVVAENQAIFRYHSTEFTTRLIAGAYPDYEQIIPANFATTGNVSVDIITQAIKGAGLFSANGVYAVELKFLPTEQIIQIAAASSQTGEYNTEIEAKITGAPVTLLLNHRYLLDGLQQLNSASATLQIVNGDSPCVLTADDGQTFRYVIMPIRQ